jgi:Uma2 family endonuclease
MDTATSLPETYDVPPTIHGAPSWPIALLFPFQGYWTEEDYLSLHNRGDRLIELSDGQIEVLPMASPLHQRILIYLFKILEACVIAARAGEVLIASMPVRLGPGNYRDPDIVFLKPGRITDPKKQPQGADLVIEIVSGDGDDRKRDYETKRFEYARAGIAEYWIVDPKMELITLLVLSGAEYKVHGEYRPGSLATSLLLPDFSVDVKCAFAAGLGAETLP